MGGAMSEGIRRNPRHHVDDQLAMEIVIRRVGEDAPLDADAKLIDISRRGLKLSLSEPLKFNEMVDIKLRCSEPHIDFVLSAEVKWLRHNSDAMAWIIGCSVSNQIPDEFFKETAMYGAYDRRSALRYDFKKLAVARWEACQDEIPVGIVNMSPGGFCISSPEPGHVDKRIWLDLENTDGKRIHVTARSVWQVQFESGYLIGCESSVDLSREIIREPKSLSICESHRRSLSLPSLIGIVLIAFFLLAFAMLG